MNLKLSNIMRNEKGFTLVEILVVIAIIAVLVTIALTTLSGRTDDARDSVDKANITIIQGAVDLFYVDHGEYPDDLDDLYDEALGPYLRTPQDELEQDGIKYVIDTNNGTVTVTVTVEEEE